MERQQLSDQFKAIYHQEPDLVVKSPGRINIIGEHTDYNEGFVLPTAIDKAIYVALGKRGDQEIHLYAADFKESYHTDLQSLAPTDKGWPNYILGVVNQLLERGLPLTGFNLFIDGDVPLGAGLSSSAAVECAVGYGLNNLYDLGLDRVEIAKIGQLAEHTYAGVKCGIMDQFASILSKAGNVVKLDCRDLSYSYVPLELGDYEVVLLNTNVKHSLASSAYNDRRQSCETAVALIQEKYPEVNSLRDVTMDMLLELVKPVNEDSFIKGKFVIEENERLNKACDALIAGDIPALGEQLFLAHDALSNEYEVSCKELDFLVDQAKKKDEVVGARMMGGGFGGCTINIVKKGYGKQWADELAPLYQEAFDLELTPIFVKTDNGSELVY